MNPSSVLRLLRTMGPGWLFWRGLYETMQRTGLQERRFPPSSPEVSLAGELGVPRKEIHGFLHERWTRESPSLFVEQALLHAASHIAEPETVIAAAEGALRGRFPFFSHGTVDVGVPADWLRNPVTGVRYPGDRHWARIPDLSSALGDIKYVWELSRGAQIYLFVRAYALTGDERYAEAFWYQVEDWIRANPVQLGPNWRCGQEVALRSFAWCFGLWAFQSARSTTPARVGRLIAMLWAHAGRIERNHWYAVRCVRNNHALSEAAGMYTIGMLFPFLPGAERWRRVGQESLEREALWQIHPDGTYVQHSMNYARLVVQLLNWVLALHRWTVGGPGLDPTLLSRANALLHFLWSVQDETTGRLPNYGSNDGALIFPLSSCDYLDYRPSLNALSLLLKDEHLYGPGPWNEEAAWFGLFERAGGLSSMRKASAPVRVSSAFRGGGYYVLRGEDHFALVRCGAYKHRPSQADMLHVDYWYKGHNLLTDPGTYSYNTVRPWQSYFVGTSAHNTVTVDGRDQMTKGARFVWIDWVRGIPLRFEEDEGGVTVQGEHQAYAPVTHRRTVTLEAQRLIVVDDLSGDDATEHTFRLHWLLGEEVVERGTFGGVVSLEEEGGQLLILAAYSPHSGLTKCTRTVGSWVRGQEEPPRGWRSLYYGQKEPVWSYSLEVTAAAPVRFVTVVQPMTSGRSPVDLERPQAVETLLGSSGQPASAASVRGS